MMNQKGLAGDTDYAKVGSSYSSFRQPEPSIAALIERALGTASTVLNVGAGAGSYEPIDRLVTAVEPAAAMRLQRAAHLVEAIDALAEDLPFEDASFDASMSTFSVHQWANLKRGLSEMRRVTRGPVVILSCDPDRVQDFWLNRYAPEVLAAERRRYPSIADLSRWLGGRISVEPVAIPLHCRDGFNEAYYGRPEQFLEPRARLACSAWSFASEASVTRAVQALRDDLASGVWDQDFGGLRAAPFFHGSLRLIVSQMRSEQHPPGGPCQS